MSMCSPMGRSMCMTWTLLDSRWLSPRAYRPAPAPAVPSHALAMARCMSALAEMVAPVATGACSLMIWSAIPWFGHSIIRSEEHTSELQSRLHLVCRLLLEKKKKSQILSLSLLKQKDVYMTIYSSYTIRENDKLNELSQVYSQLTWKN